MSFDLLAPHYRWMEFVLAQNKLQHCRTAFLDEIHEPQNILILGEGNGRFLLECRKKFPRAQITCVDASSGMLEQARQRLEKNVGNENNVEFIHADALAWKPAETDHDLIVTHFFLDCFRAEQLDQLVTKLSRVAKPRATWLVADFQSPANGWRRIRAQIILGMMYVFFRLATRLPANKLISPDEILAKNGFRLRERCVSEWGLLRTDRWEKTGPRERPEIVEKKFWDSHWKQWLPDRCLAGRLAQNH